MYKVKIIICVLLLSSCASQPLSDYINKHEYTLFVVLRDKDGAGTVVRFVEGEESILASPDAPLYQCLNETNVPRGKRKAALESYKYKFSLENDLELKLAKSEFENLELENAFKLSSVKSVSIELVNPFEEYITEVSVMNYRRGIKDDDPCASILVKDGSLLIHTVLGAEGIKYSFQDKNGAEMRLHAKLLESLDANNSFRVKNEGAKEINLDSKIYIGYRVWELVELPGFDGIGLSFNDLTRAQVEKIRLNSK